MWYLSWSKWHFVFWVEKFRVEKYSVEHDWFKNCTEITNKLDINFYLFIYFYLQKDPLKITFQY